MKWPLNRKFKIFSKQSGLTLLEVLIALAIFSAIGIVYLRAINSNTVSVRIIDEEVVASNLIDNYFEAIFNSPYSNTYSDASGNISIPFGYNVTVNVKCSSDGTNFYDCIGSDNETLQKINLNVLREGKPILSQCTYRTRME